MKRENVCPDRSAASPASARSLHGRRMTWRIGTRRRVGRRQPRRPESLAKAQRALLRLARLSQQRQLLAPGLPELVDETGRIVAGEAMIGELRLSRVAPGIAHGAIDAVDGEERERVGADEPTHSLEVHARGEQLVALGR